MQAGANNSPPVNSQRPDEGAGPKKVRFESALRFAWIPIPILLAFIVVGWFIAPLEPVPVAAFLRGPFHFFLGAVVPAWAAVLASKSFLRDRSVPILIFSCGLLIYATVNVFTSFVYHYYGEVYALFVVYTVGMAMVAITYLVGTVVASMAGDWTVRKNPRFFLAGTYALTVLFTGLLVLIGFNLVFTPQFVEEIGFTTLRRIMLTPIVILFALDSLILLWLSHLRNWSFGKWYGFALGLIATGMLALAGTPNVEAFSTAWIGRTAYYLGGLYLLIAMLESPRAKSHWALLAYSALRESEERFRALSEATWEGVAICQEGVIIDANEQLGRLLDYSVPELIGRSVSDLLPEEYDSPVIACFLSNVEVAVEHPMIRKYGSQIMVESYARTISRYGRTMQLWGMRDITARKRQEQAVRDSEEQFRALFDNMSEGLGVGEPVFDENGVPCDIRFLKVNRAFKEQTGINEDVVGKPFKTVLPKLERTWVEMQSSVALTGKSVRFDQFNRDTNRHYHCVSFSPAKGKFAVLFSDITEEKRNQEISRIATETNARNLAKTRAILEQMTEGLVILDPQGNVVELNEAALRMHGFADTEDVFRHLVDLDGIFRTFEMLDLAGNPLPHEEWPICRVLRGESFESYNVQMRRKDTGKQWIASIGGCPVYDEEGNLLAAIFTLRDFTAQHEAQKALKRSRDELEQRVSERTIELQQRADQLARLTSELTLTEQRERKRLAQLLHDQLQQLLVGAKFGLHLLAQRVSAEQKVAVEEVNKVLDESIEASRSITVELSPPILHEGGLAAGLEWLARWMKTKHGLEVDLNIGSRLTVDREDVRLLVFQGVRELLFNVCKHAHVKDARVELFQSDGEIRAVVEDQGIGFDVADVLGKPQELSGGFGLFSIRERLDLLGGRLDVESAPGHGARFTLVAPLQAEPEVPPEREEPSTELLSKAARVVAPDTGGREDRIKLLLVDDHAVLRQGLSLLLMSQEGVEIVGEAADGIQALDRARELNPGVVLMDFSMPHMDGVEATRAIREELPHVRVIGLSMYEDVDRSQAMIDAGASAYLCKSGQAEKLLNTIRRVAATDTTAWRKDHIN